MVTMLQNLTAASFEGLVGSDFRLDPAEAGITSLRLVEAKDVTGRYGAGPRRAPFTLLFRGPKSPLLSQRIYALVHEALGRLEIFLVPLGPDPEGMRYEAVFN
jgi:hypothetical protein